MQRRFKLSPVNAQTGRYDDNTAKNWNQIQRDVKNAVDVCGVNAWMHTEGYIKDVEIARDAFTPCVLDLFRGECFSGGVDAVTTAVWHAIAERISIVLYHFKWCLSRYTVDSCLEEQLWMYYRGECVDQAELIADLQNPRNLPVLTDCLVKADARDKKKVLAVLT